jgi:hypothetical protein
MTTPTTPAGWYPDPEDASSLRYWDGDAWTEHGSPAAAPTATPAEEPVDEFPASEQATSVVSLPEQPTTVVKTQPTAEHSGSHRTPDAEPEPDPGATVVVPTVSPAAPSFEQPPTFETPSFEEISKPTYEVPKYEAPAAAAPSYETPSYAAPSYETPSYGTPSYETPSYGAPSYETPAFGAPAFGAPPGPPAPPELPVASDGSGGGPGNRKVLIGYLSAVGALLVVLVLLLVYAFVIRDNKPTQLATPTLSTASSTTTKTSSSTTETTETSTPNAGGNATLGDFVFSVASTDTGDTITSPIDESVVKAATGEYFVVYLDIGNNGTSPLTWLSVLQLLSDGNQTYPPDVEASAALSGTNITINPGDQLETALAFDVPVGTTPTSIQLHGLPGDAGVELPVS